MFFPLLHLSAVVAYLAVPCSPRPFFLFFSSARAWVIFVPYWKLMVWWVEVAGRGWLELGWLLCYLVIVLFDWWLRQLLAACNTTVVRWWGGWGENRQLKLAPSHTHGRIGTLLLYYKNMFKYSVNSQYRYTPLLLPFASWGFSVDSILNLRRFYVNLRRFYVQLETWNPFLYNVSWALSWVTNVLRHLEVSDIIFWIHK